jgi:hypothetical protein
MTVRRRITTLALGGLLAGAGLPATAGAEPGLTVDPQSPAGVEYAVPLDQGRGHGGSGQPGGGSSTPSPANGGGTSDSGSQGGASGLFGSGIKPHGKKDAGSDGGKKEASPKGGARSGGGASGGSGGAAPRRVAPVEASAAYSTTAPLAGLIGAVLLLGGGIGLLLRRRARSH